MQRQSGGSKANDQVFSFWNRRTVAASFFIAAQDGVERRWSAAIAGIVGRPAAAIRAVAQCDIDAGCILRQRRLGNDAVRGTGAGPNMLLRFGLPGRWLGATRRTHDNAGNGEQPTAGIEKELSTGHARPCVP